MTLFFFVLTKYRVFMKVLGGHAQGVVAVAHLRYVEI